MSSIGNPCFFIYVINYNSTSKRDRQKNNQDRAHGCQCTQFDYIWCVGASHNSDLNRIFRGSSTRKSEVFLFDDIELYVQIHLEIIDFQFAR